MSSSGPITVVFGSAVVGNRDPFVAEDDINAVFSILEAHHVRNLDSAQRYGDSEKRLGEVKAGNRFTIDTKWQGGLPPGWATKENMVNSAIKSLERLGIKQVDIFYIHAPDPQTDLEETLSGVNQVYKTGAFKRFGLSNYLTADVEKVHSICNAKGYVLPTVYQGNYSAVARLQETKLFPTLRKLNMAFYAYSPLAGGFLTKTAQQIQDGAGRFNMETAGGVYRQMFMKPSYLEALAKWEAIAKDEGVSRAELAYRWVASNSPLDRAHGDAIIIGASSIEQLKQTLEGIEKGKLSDKAVQAIDAIWDTIKHEAPLDSFNK